MKTKQIEQAYELACEAYAEHDVNVEQALKRLARVPISMHCWQGDDVGGFENAGTLDGGLVATGNHPGKARTPAELRQDIEKAYSLIPGRHRLNLHAIYAETDGRKVDRNKLEYAQFEGWVKWARKLGIGLDFNPTFFAHPKASSGFTLSSRDSGVRKFWVEHGIACRRIAEKMGKELGKTVVTNFWIPDGYKDNPVDRKTPRLLLEKSLDEIFSRETNLDYNVDAVESKLFGIGSESYVVGSHEFYLGYAVKNSKLICLDTGHFHPTETIADKISSVLVYLDEALLHVSRGVRWDSDHVVVMSDDLRTIAEEIVRGDYLDRVHIGLDYFDASINRVAAWVVGMRCMQRALLMALLEPTQKIAQFEKSGDLTSRLAMMEEAKALPAVAVWNYFCLKQDVPVGAAWLDEVAKYEKTVLSKR